MLNEMQTLVDTRVAAHAPDIVNGDEGLIAGRYRLLRPLGEGGMGHVYLASDQLLTRQVAIKTIRPELSDNEEVRARIRRECRMHAALGVHPHIVALHDTVEEDGRIYLVMEYFAGETLARHLADAAPSGLALDQALEIIRQVLHALVCIHGQGIVHRDIKTANVLLQQQADGHYRAKLTDFGIARAEIEASAMTRLTSLGVQGPGTPVYMAPERIDSQSFGDVCPASDLYAVGIIFYELLTGQPPFTGSMTEIFTGHLVQQPDLAGLPTQFPAQLHTIIAKALAKQPGERFQRAEDFIDVLAGLDETPMPPRTAFAPPSLKPATEEATLLAAHAEPPPVVPGATILNPVLGQGRRQPGRPSRSWLVVALIGLFLLMGYLVSTQWKPFQPTSTPLNTATTAEERQSSPSIPDAATLPNGPAASETVTALETVEQVREQKGAESMAAADRASASPASEWQVIEDRSRRIR